MGFKSKNSAGLIHAVVTRQMVAMLVGRVLGGGEFGYRNVGVRHGRCGKVEPSRRLCTYPSLAIAPTSRLLLLNPAA